jgi:hypothetical protein
MNQKEYEELCANEYWMFTFSAMTGIAGGVAAWTWHWAAFLAAALLLASAIVCAVQFIRGSL